MVLFLAVVQAVTEPDAPNKVHIGPKASHQMPSKKISIGRAVGRIVSARNIPPTMAFQ